MATVRSSILSSRWSFALWLPLAAASCGFAAYVFREADDGTIRGTGPGGGGEGFQFLIVWVSRLLAVLVCVGCFVLRPRGAAWNGRAVAISTLAWLFVFTSAAIAYPRMTGVTVHVRAVDTAGRPLSGIRMGYLWSKRLPLYRRTKALGAAVTDAGGIATFRVPAFDTLYITGDQELRPTNGLSIDAQGGALQISHVKDGVSSQVDNAPKAPELNMSITFDPPTNR